MKANNSAYLPSRLIPPLEAERLYGYVNAEKRKKERLEARWGQKGREDRQAG